MKIPRKMIACFFAAALLSGCGSQPPQTTAPAEEVTLSVTRWTDRTELFMEYPALVAGQTGRFAVHFTDIRTFRPVTNARVVVELTDDRGDNKEFVADPQTRPGIFGVNVTPPAPGTASIAVRVQASGLNDIVPVGDVTIFPDQARAASAAQPEPAEETVAFLKEQQWSLDFGTAPVATRRLRAGLLVPAEVIPRNGGSAEVTAPFNGRLVVSALPIIGTLVEQGQVLAQLLPPTSSPSDLAALEASQTQTSAELSLARRERERVERLVAGGAVPARRLDEARTAETTAEARLKAAESRLAQYDASSAAEADARGARLFALRSPIAGTVAETHAAAGANVEAGETLFRIVDLDSVYVSAIVPESELPRIRNLTGAELEIPGSAAPVRLQRLISVGRVVDPASRTFPVIYEFDNRGQRVAVNQTVHVRLLTTAAAGAVAVPESAIVDDAGRPIVFVQLAGESFARRPVTLGIREAGFVQVLQGVREGERVVSVGAPLIRLASMSSQVPAHGHVH